jgi:hypothetical protein
MCDRWIAKHPKEFEEDQKQHRHFLGAVAAMYKRGLEQGINPCAEWIHEQMGWITPFEVSTALEQLEVQGHLERIKGEVDTSENSGTIP